MIIRDKLSKTAFLVLSKHSKQGPATLYGAVWKAPQPYNDWYWGIVEKQVGEMYHLAAWGSEKTSELARKKVITEKPQLNINRQFHREKKAETITRGT